MKYQKWLVMTIAHKWLSNVFLTQKSFNIAQNDFIQTAGQMLAIS